MHSGGKAPKAFPQNYTSETESCSVKGEKITIQFAMCPKNNQAIIVG